MKQARRGGLLRAAGTPLSVAELPSCRKTHYAQQTDTEQQHCASPRDTACDYICLAQAIGSAALLREFGFHGYLLALRCGRSCLRRNRAGKRELARLGAKNRRMLFPLNATVNVRVVALGERAARIRVKLG